ncbi:MAG TPA: hypothetical protein VNA69_11485 [Thermoanaerobaculia bacterium]|nr:hypothetical protein [Thermoanaerobaculia bacterium]
MSTVTASAADVQVVLTSSVGTVGGHGSFDVQITRTTTEEAQNVVATISLPAGATFLSILRPLHIPVPECSTPAAGQPGEIICTYPVFDSALPFTIHFQIDPYTPEGTSVIVRASLVASNDEHEANNQFQLVMPVAIGGADVIAAKRLVLVEPLGSEGSVRLTYELTATNSGPHLARDLRLTDTWSNLSMESVQCINSIPDLAEFLPRTCIANTLGIGQSIGMTFIASAARGQIPFVFNQATVTSRADPNQSNDTAAAASVPADVPLGPAALASFAVALAVCAMAVLQQRG